MRCNGSRSRGPGSIDTRGEKNMKNYCPPRVLIVDDDRPCRVATMRILQEAGYPAISCANTLEAVSFMGRCECHLVLVDQHIAAMNGFALLRAIQAEYPEISFILMAVNPDTSIQQEACRLGSVGFLLKPFGSTSLLTELDAWEKAHCRRGTHNELTRKESGGRTSGFYSRKGPNVQAHTQIKGDTRGCVHYSGG